MEIDVKVPQIDSKVDEKCNTVEVALGEDIIQKLMKRGCTLAAER